jgi:hypothetical protein
MWVLQVKMKWQRCWLFSGLRVRRRQEKLSGALWPQVSPTPPLSCGNPGGDCLRQNGRCHRSERVRYDYVSVLTCPGFLTGALWVFSELPGRRAERRVQIFPPRLLASEGWFLSLRAIKVHQILLPVPGTLLWSTSVPLQRLSSTRGTFLGTPECAYQLDTVPTKALIHFPFKISIE